MGYDEIAHSPDLAASVPASHFRSQVAFIGTRMEHRPEFLINLVKRGVPLSIWGNGWKNGPGWRILKDYWRGPGLLGAEYVAAVQRADICLGLLSKGNRDLHTTRSSEIPFAGGLLCAERTSEHLEMYKEGEQAVFWSDAEECAEVCLQLLNDRQRRDEIRRQGLKRVRELGVGNEDTCRAILADLDGLRSRTDALSQPAQMFAH
jgi:hypothetical protein